MKIVTILPIPWHLDIKYYWKDLIQIWNTFKKIKWFDAEFWTLNKKTKWFKYKWIKFLWFKSKFNIILTLIKDKKVTLLHLYWINRYTLIISIICKIFNKSSKIYIKADMPLYQKWQDNREKLNKIPYFLINILIKSIDYLGLENKDLIKYFKTKFPKYKKKFLFLPCWAINLNNFHNIKYKKNIISLCWRFWAKEKNYELLIKALKDNNIDNLKWWKIQLIWDMTLEFKKQLEDLLNEKKILKNIIEYKWFILEKKGLYENLIHSKLFIITSLSEWEPNVQFDSMFCWNFILSTNVGTVKNNYPKKYCDFFINNNSNDLYKKISLFINYEKKLNIEDYNNIQKYCLNNFIWEKSLKPLLDNF